jgi:hypothetical protein
VGNEEVLKMVYNISLSNKQIKDIYHNIDEFLFNDNRYLKEYILEIREKIVVFAREFYEYFKDSTKEPSFTEITRDIAVAIKNGEISPYLSITLLNVNEYINRAIRNLSNR